MQVSGGDCHGCQVSSGRAIPIPFWVYGSKQPACRLNLPRFCKTGALVFFLTVENHYQSGNTMEDIFPRSYLI